MWEEGRHPQRLESDEMMVPKRESIHLNPLQRGDVDEPAHRRWSSARNDAGTPGLIEVITRW